MSMAGDSYEPAPYGEADLLPLSGLQHLVYCERQCALIHIERAWRDNVLTAEGKLLHQRVDSGKDETRGDLRVVRSLPVRSLRLGLVGKLDVLELSRAQPSDVSAGLATALPRLEGLWIPVPVEYKRGKPKAGDCDRVQVCAQAICLEEMLSVRIPRSVLFYGERRRRFDVDLDESLRTTTTETARRFHELIAAGATPAARRQRKCQSCSLLDVCLPSSRRHSHSAQDYLREELALVEPPGGRNP